MAVVAACLGVAPQNEMQQATAPVARRLDAQRRALRGGRQLTKKTTATAAAAATATQTTKSCNTATTKAATFWPYWAV